MILFISIHICAIRAIISRSRERKYNFPKLLFDMSLSDVHRTRFCFKNASSRRSGLGPSVIYTRVGVHVGVRTSIRFQTTHVYEPFSPDFRRRGYRACAWCRARAYETSTGFLLRDILLICGRRLVRFLLLFPICFDSRRERSGN